MAETDKARTPGFLALEKTANDHVGFSNILWRAAARHAVDENWDEVEPLCEEIHQGWNLRVCRDDVIDFILERSSLFSEACSTNEGSKQVAPLAAEAYEDDLEEYLSLAEDTLPLLREELMDKFLREVDDLDTYHRWLVAVGGLASKEAVLSINDDENLMFFHLLDIDQEGELGDSEKAVLDEMKKERGWADVNHVNDDVL